MNWKRMLIGFAVGVPILGLLVFGLTRDPRVIPSPMPGQPAPAFELRALDTGEPVRLEDMAGQVVVLNFWASWCGPCRVEHPNLTAAAEAYRDRGVRFLGLLYNDRPASARDWLDRLGEAYPTLIDDRSRTAIDYGVYGVPETFVIDRTGKVRYKKTGPIQLSRDFLELQAVLETILAEPVDGTRPSGAGTP